MVKKWITMIILSIILIVGCIIESIYVNRTFNWLINSLETIQIEITENKEHCDTDELIHKTYDLHDKWHKKTKILKCIIWHTGIKDVEIGLARIAVYIQENDFTEAYAEIASLIDYCAHYLDDFCISTENIF